MTETVHHAGIPEPAEITAGRFTLSLEGLAALQQILRADGLKLIGLTVRDGAIVDAEIQGIEDLPADWTEVQEAGTYRLERRVAVHCGKAGGTCFCVSREA